MGEPDSPSPAARNMNCCSVGCALAYSASVCRDPPKRRAASSTGNRANHRVFHAEGNGKNRLSRDERFGAGRRCRRSHLGSSAKLRNNRESVPATWKNYRKAEGGMLARAPAINSPLRSYRYYRSRTLERKRKVAAMGGLGNNHVSRRVYQGGRHFCGP